MDAVGVIGLGAMGRPIATHLRRGGFAGVGFDIAPAARERARAAGVDAVESLGDLVATTDAAVVLVGTDDQVLDVLVGAGGVFSLLGADGTRGYQVAVASTITPSTMTAITHAAPAAVTAVDVPLARGEHGAASGTLLGLFGGPRQECDAWGPALHTFCSDVVRVGDVGTGQIAKSLNNYVLWACVCANAEALRLGATSGCDLDRLRDALLLGSGANWALDTWLLTRPMPWAEDDMRIVSHLEGDGEVDLPFARATSAEIAQLKQRKAALGLAGASMDAYLRAELRGAGATTPPGEARTDGQRAEPT